VNAEDWESDLRIAGIFGEVWERLPAELRTEHEAVVGRFQKSVPA